MTLWASADDYLRAEWEQFFAHPALGQRTLDAVAAWDVATVLDIGCGAGQEMIPFLTAKGATGTGIEIRAQTLPVARDLLASVGLGNRVKLVCANAEALPLRSARFDAIILRGVLPFTDNRVALAESGRVLRGRGVMIVQVDNHQKALANLRRHLLARDWRRARASAGKILNGVIYEVRGRQPTSARWGSEVAYSRRLLNRVLRRAGFTIVADIPHGNPRSFAVVATPGA